MNSMSYNPVKTMLLDSVLITRHYKALLTHSVQWTRLTLATRPPQLKDMAYKRLTSTNQLISQLLPGLFANNTKMISTVLTKKVISTLRGMQSKQDVCVFFLFSPLSLDSIQFQLFVNLRSWTRTYISPSRYGLGVIHRFKSCYKV